MWKYIVEENHIDSVVSLVQTQRDYVTFIYKDYIVFLRGGGGYHKGTIRNLF